MGSSSRARTVMVWSEPALDQKPKFSSSKISYTLS